MHDKNTLAVCFCLPASVLVLKSGLCVYEKLKSTQIQHFLFKLAYLPGFKIMHTIWGIPDGCYGFCLLHLSLQVHSPFVKGWRSRRYVRDHVNLP